MIWTRSVVSPLFRSCRSWGSKHVVGDPRLLELAHAHHPVHPKDRRREAVALLAAVVAVPPKRAPVQQPRARDLEQVVLREAAVSLQGDGPAPELPTPERVLPDHRFHSRGQLARGEDRKGRTDAQVRRKGTGASAAADTRGLGFPRPAVARLPASRRSSSAGLGARGASASRRTCRRARRRPSVWGS